MQQKKKDKLTFTLFLIQLFDFPAPRPPPSDPQVSDPSDSV